GTREPAVFHELVANLALRRDEVPTMVACEHMTHFETVASAAVDRDDLELAELGNAFLHRHDPRADRLVRCARHVRRKCGLTRRREAVATVDFLLRLRDFECRR